MLAVSRYERIHYDLQTLCQALEDAQIPFIPLKGSVIRAYYPWLTPVMQVHRWFKILFSGRTKRSIKELSYNQNISSAQMQQLRKLFKEIGL